MTAPFPENKPPASTPVRALGHAGPGGVHLLRDVGSSYRDGGEEAVLAIVDAASDLHSDSDELIRAASSWAERYHVDPARANVLRSFDLPADARVLEIGAGCGAITRYLGEQCAVVDALEPVPARAAVARARTRDLPNVEVFVGNLDDVPAEPGYDVVIVIGVLEYVGAGSADRRPYLDFLDGIRDRLVDGGTLVLAIENQLGVKYLAGAPEDHSDRVWDSLDGYAGNPRARTFSRRRLEALMTDSGLQPHTRAAFPDYKMTRVVLGDVPDDCRALLSRVPALPSPDWRSKRPKIGSEYALWRQLVDAGLEAEFGNSLVVVAHKPAPDAPNAVLWPDERLGVFFSTARRRELQVRTDIERVDGAVRFRRAPRSPAAVDDGGLRVVASVEPFQPGTDLDELVAERGVEAFGEFADAWLELVDRALAEDPGSVIDLIPHNLVLDDNGTLVPIDVEFTNYPATRDQVIRRGIFNLGHRATPLAGPTHWAPARTVGDVMTMLGRHVGLPSDGSWLEAFYAEELAFHAAIRAVPRTPERYAHWERSTDRRLRSIPAQKLTALPLGERVWDQHKRAEAALKKERAESTRLRAELSTAQATARRAQQAERRLARAPEVRAVRRVRRAVARAVPRGTARGRVARRLLSATRR